MQKIEVVAYNPEWVEDFQKEATLIKHILGDNVLQVFHIGSTAIPELQAKPVIDIMPIVKDLSLVDACKTKFEKVGYEVMGEFGISGRRFMKKGGEEHRSHHIHIFCYDNTYAILRHLAFKEYLVYHPKEREEYASIKAALALRYRNDIEGYCAGKDDFVKDVEKRALQWYFKTYKNP